MGLPPKRLDLFEDVNSRLLEIDKVHNQLKEGQSIHKWKNNVNYSSKKEEGRTM
jgi:hypothetical protein